MNASLVNSFASLRVSARPQQPSLSFKASVGGQQLVGEFLKTLVASRIGHGMWEWSPAQHVLRAAPHPMFPLRTDASNTRPTASS